MNFNGENIISAAESLANGGSIAGNLGISGDLDIGGTLTTAVLEAETIVSELKVEDALIELAINNPTDTINSGFYSKHGILYSGLIRSRVDKKYYLINDDAQQPTEANTITNTDGDLRLNGLEAASIDIGDYSLPTLLGNESDVLSVSGGNLVFDAPTVGNPFNQSLNKEDSPIFNRISFDKLLPSDTRLIQFQTASANNFRIVDSNDVLTISYGNLNLPAMRIHASDGKVYIGNNIYSFPKTLGTDGHVLTSNAGALEFKALPSLPQPLDTIDSPEFSGLQINSSPNEYTLPTSRAGAENKVIVSDATNETSWADPPNIWDNSLNQLDTPTFAGLTIGNIAYPSAIGGAETIMVSNGSTLSFQPRNQWDQNLNTTDTIEANLFKLDKPLLSDTRLIHFLTDGIPNFQILDKDDVLRISYGINVPALRIHKADGKVYIGNDIYSFPQSLGAQDTVLTSNAGALEFKSLPSLPQGLGSGDSPEFAGLTIGTSPNEYVMPTADGTAGQVLQTDGAGNVDWVEGVTQNGPAVVNNIPIFDNTTGDLKNSSVNLSSNILDAINSLKNTAGTSYVQGGGADLILNNTGSVRTQVGGALKIFAGSAETQLHQQISIRKTGAGDQNINFTDGNTVEYRFHSKNGDSALYLDQVVAGIPGTVMKFGDSANKEIDINFETFVNKPLTVKETSNTIVKIESTVNGDATLDLDKKLAADEAKIDFRENGVLKHSITNEAGNVLVVKNDVNDLLIFNGNDAETGVNTSFKTQDLRIADNGNINFHKIADNAGYLELTDLALNPVVRVGAANVEIKQPVICDYLLSGYKKFFGIGLAVDAELFHGIGNVATASQTYTSLLGHTTTIGTLTIPANTVATGTKISGKLSGYIFNNNRSIDIRVQLNAVTVVEILNHNPNGNTSNEAFEFEFDLSCIEQVGNLFDVVANCELTYHQDTTNSNAWEGDGGFALLPVTGFSTTGTHVLDVEFRWGGTGANVVNQQTEIKFSTLKYP